jgi:hypothetical protein
MVAGVAAPVRMLKAVRGLAAGREDMLEGEDGTEEGGAEPSSTHASRSCNWVDQNANDQA